MVLNRPEKRNALSDDLIAALDRFFAQVPKGTRAIVLSGAGGHFSAGLDLSQHVARQLKRHFAVGIGKASVQQAERVAHCALGGSADFAQRFILRRSPNAA